MAEFRPNGRNLKSLLRSRQVEQRALVPVAEKLAPIIAAATPRGKHPGQHTADTTSVQTGHMSVKGDRVAVRIVQRSYSGRGRPPGGAAAPLQYGNRITQKRAQFTKALKIAYVKGGL